MPSTTIEARAMLADAIDATAMEPSYRKERILALAEDYAREYALEHYGSMLPSRFTGPDPILEAAGSIVKDFEISASLTQEEDVRAVANIIEGAVIARISRTAIENDKLLELLGWAYETHLDAEHDDDERRCPSPTWNEIRELTEASR